MNGTIMLRLPKLELATGLKSTAIYEKNNPDSPYYDESFPKPVKLGVRAVGYVEAEVEAWLQAQIEKSRVAA